MPSPLALWNVHLRKRRPARLNDDTRPEAQPRARPSCERDQPPPAPPHRAEPTRASLELASGSINRAALVFSLARNPGQQFASFSSPFLRCTSSWACLAARGVPWCLTGHRHAPLSSPAEAPGLSRGSPLCAGGKTRPLLLAQQRI